MVDALNDAMAIAAAGVLDVVGTAATLTREGALSYNAATGVETSVADTQEAVIISPPNKVDLKRVDGTAVRRTDFMCILKARGLATPPEQTGFLLTFGSTQYKVVEVNPVYAGKDPAVYELVLRR